MNSLPVSSVSSASSVLPVSMVQPEQQVLDLRTTPSSQLQSVAFNAVKSLPEHGSLLLLFAETPDWVMQSLNLCLRNNLAWTVAKMVDESWEVLVRRAVEVPPTDVIDVLKREHKRLDALFAQVIHLTDRGRLDDAAQVMRAFVAGLRVHLDIEHGMLVAAIRTPTDAQGVNPSEALVQEHSEILHQSTLIELEFADPGSQVSTVSPLLAILAGYLSKHELREELVMLPIWKQALSRAPQAMQDALLARILKLLEYGKHT